MGDLPKFKIRSKTLADLLGRPPLVAGEDKAAFIELRARLVEALKPNDIMEHFITEDVLNRAWDVCKWRRAKAVFLTIQLQTGLNGTMDPSLCRKADGAPLDADELQGIIGGACSGDGAAISQLDQLLAPHNLTFSALADAVQVTDPAVLRIVSDIERQIFVAESQREAAIDHLFRYREQRRKHLGQREITKDPESSDSEDG